MRSTSSDQEKLFQLAAICQEAVQAQQHRAASQGYGLDDYTEGRIVGAANLARKMLRVLTSAQLDASRPIRPRVQLRNPLGR